MQYYYHDGKEQKGPYTFNELISLGIKQETKVWREGLQDWQNAGELVEFRQILKQPVMPPPFKEKPADPPPFTETKPKPAEQPATKKTVTQQVEKKSNYSGVIIAFAVIGILATAAFFYSQYNQARGKDGPGYETPAETYEEKKMSLAEQEAAYPTNFLSTKGHYRPTLIGKKFAVEIELNSTATIATYKDIRIEFIYYTRTKTEISRKTYTFYEFVESGKTVTIETKIDRPETATILDWEVVGALVGK